MRRDERGSALLLLPAGVLILVVLASLTVDRAIVLGAQRDLVATAQAAANNAVAAGLDPAALRGEGVLAHDPARVQAVLRATIDRSAPPGTGLRWWVTDQVLHVELRARAPLLFSKAMPGSPGSVEITARVSAVLSPG